MLFEMTEDEYEQWRNMTEEEMKYYSKACDIPFDEIQDVVDLLLYAGELKYGY